MESSVDDVKYMYQMLNTEWNKENPNFNLCNDILLQIKIEMTKHTFLPVIDMKAPQKEYIIVRDILEVGVQCSIALRDISSFERYMAQLKCYYFDYKDKLPDSAYQYHLLGLNLLFLLSQNRIAEFHMELELLPFDVIETNPYIIHPMTLEQYFMEGSYNKIFEARSNIPSDTYNFFMNILLNTLQNEIAECLEKSYKKISLISAMKMLHINTLCEMNKFAAKKHWNLDQNLHYVFNHEDEKKLVEPLSALEVAKFAFQYSKEFDTIV